MTAFTSSSRRSQYTRCRETAAEVASACMAMGLIVTGDASRLSASQYLYISRDEDELPLKIRISDHRGGGADLCYDALYPTDYIISEIAERFGTVLPESWTAARIARHDAAKKAAATRGAKRQADEAEMVEAVASRLERITRPAANRIFKGLFPGRPDAQRKRVLDKALARAKEVAAIAAAGDDDEALADVARKSLAAREILRSRVSPERFAQLRPSGHPRSCWND